VSSRSTYPRSTTGITGEQTLSRTCQSARLARPYREHSFARYPSLKVYNQAGNGHGRGGKQILSKRSLHLIVCRGIGILILSGLGAASLVRLAPGFGAEEQALDARLSAQTRDALELRHAGERNPLVFYAHFLVGLLHGDAGQSTVFGQPVRDLIQDRAGTTIVAVSAGLAGGWCAAVLLGLAVAYSRRTLAVLPAFAFSGSLLSMPSAVLAMVCLLLGLPPAIAIGAVVFPRVFPHAYEQLRGVLAAPHVLMARASGISGARLLFFYVGPSALMPLVALAGVSVTLAFGASIPIEALSDSPGIGQLAWRAALGRDVPVLVMVTLLLTAVTVFANVMADIAIWRAGSRSV
jgi:peptide/nickel transport system permease protein